MKRPLKGMGFTQLGLSKLKMNIYCAMMLVVVHRVCLVSFREPIENYSAEAG